MSSETTTASARSRRRDGMESARRAVTAYDNFHLRTALQAMQAFVDGNPGEDVKHLVEPFQHLVGAIDCVLLPEKPVAQDPARAVKKQKIEEAVAGAGDWTGDVMRNWPMVLSNEDLGIDPGNPPAPAANGPQPPAAAAAAAAASIDAELGEKQQTTGEKDATSSPSTPRYTTFQLHCRNGKSTALLVLAILFALTIGVMPMLLPLLQPASTQVPLHTMVGSATWQATAIPVLRDAGLLLWILVGVLHQHATRSHSMQPAFLVVFAATYIVNSLRHLDKLNVLANFVDLSVHINAFLGIFNVILLLGSLVLVLLFFSGSRCAWTTLQRLQRRSEEVGQ